MKRRSADGKQLANADGDASQSTGGQQLTNADRDAPRHKSSVKKQLDGVEKVTPKIESSTDVASDAKSSTVFTMADVFDDVLRAKSDDAVLMKGASMRKVSVNIDDDTNDHRTQLYDQMLTEFTGITRGVDFSSLFDEIDRCTLDVANQIAAVDAQIRCCR